MIESCKQNSPSLLTFWGQNNIIYGMANTVENFEKVGV